MIASLAPASLTSAGLSVHPQNVAEIAPAAILVTKLCLSAQQPGFLFSMLCFSNKEHHAWLNCVAPFHACTIGQVRQRAVHTDFKNSALSAQAVDAVLVKLLSVEIQVDKK